MIDPTMTRARTPRADAPPRPRAAWALLSLFAVAALVPAVVFPIAAAAGTPEPFRPTGASIWMKAPPVATVSVPSGQTGPIGPAVTLANVTYGGSLISVRVTVGGKVRDVMTDAFTVGQLLDSVGVTPDFDDYVFPSADSRLRNGVRIRYASVVTKVVTKTVKSPFKIETSYVSAKHMAPDTFEVIRPGRPGKKMVTMSVTLVAGKVVSRSILATRVISAPVKEIRVSGPYRPTSGTLGTGPHVAIGQATWYETPWTGLTAANPWLPFGTKVTVTDLATGSSVVVVINDRGPFSKGRIIDLSPEAFAALRHLGAGVLNVRITW